MGSYTLGDVARITGVSRARLRYWERTALLEPAGAVQGTPGPVRERRERSAFEFSDLVTIRSVLSLLDRGLSLRRIRLSVDALRARLPEVDQPLASLRTWVDGSPRVVVRYDGDLVEPNGQLVLDFSRGPARAPVDIRAAGSDGSGQQQAHEWFEQGCKLDSNRATFAEAIEAYQRAIACAPDFADAHCNLGSVYFNQDRLAHARECFARALEFDAHHVEANLNLATLLEEKGRNRQALVHYKIALEADPLCADTYVSLALLYEKLDLRRKARGYWRHYLQLEPGGTWVDIARQRLSD